MAKKKKPTAKQRRMQKAREKAERARYLESKKPKAPAPDNVTRARERKAKQELKLARQRSSAEVAALKGQQVIAELNILWDEAYRKYRRLMQAGTPNAATAIYEQNFAGMNPAANNLNKNRALIAALKKWLARKDTSTTRAKKARRKTERQFEREFGYSKMTDEERRAFWSMYNKYVEYTGGIPQGSKHYLKHFSNAYQTYRENPRMTQKELFDNARERMMKEYEQSISADTFSVDPLGL